ncbi:MAG: DUF3842 family protein [Eubacteriales bacterium]|nr:DUF3842 family protein [Eubacteriales bacterium]MDD3883096.1 DUF3842 family protein [Eubacteriales bacterium]MDD4512621.1 DUF3842 family protein [Eubacteriales bacterium]
MKIVVIDGQGGGLGRQVAEKILELLPKHELVCVGTNALATANMLKSGVKLAATGENAAACAAADADIIVGPIGIVIADSMLGEITPRIALCVGRSSAVRVLIPVNHCSNIVAGVPSAPLSTLVSDAAQRIAEIAEKQAV